MTPSPGESYFEPLLDLGTTHILDGGALRPWRGFYLLAYLQEYYAHKFTGPNGHQLTRQGTSPKLYTTALVSELVYQTHEPHFLGAHPGGNITQPLILASKITKNDISVFESQKLNTSGSGFGDLNIGFFLQWPTYLLGKNHDRPIFVHRLQLNLSIPTGKFKRWALFSPGNGFLFLNPYWAMTLYISPQWALSARFNYVWNARDKKIDIQAGQVFFTNFDLAYEPIENLWLATTGYYLKEFTDDIIHRKAYSSTREEVLAFGFGALGILPKNIFLQTALNFEILAKNRPQGLNFVVRMLKYF